MRSKVNIHVSVSESNVDHLGVWGVVPNMMRKPLHSTTYLAPSDTHFVVGQTPTPTGGHFDQHKIYVSMGAYYHNKHAKNASLIFALCQLRQAQFPYVEDYFFFLKSSFSSVFMRVLCHFAYVFVTTLYRSIVTISYAK